MLPALATADDAPAPAAKPSFDLHGDDVRSVISNTAASQYGNVAPESSDSRAARLPESSEHAWRPVEPAADDDARRAFDHYDCGLDQCVARDRDHNAMYTVPIDDPRALNDAQKRAGDLGCLPTFDALSPEQRGAYCKPATITSDYDDHRSFGERVLDELATGLLESLFGGR